jgi:DNA repair protein RadD
MEWLDVDAVSYGRGQKEGKPDSIRVTYYCGMTRISEWLCPDHGGYAASRYTARKSALRASADGTDAALAECAFWVKPSKIRVKPDGKYFQIVQLDYEQKKPPAETELDRDLKEMFADDF